MSECVSVEEWEDARQKSDQGNSTGIVDEDWTRVDELEPAWGPVLCRLGKSVGERRGECECEDEYGGVRGLKKDRG